MFRTIIAATAILSMPLAVTAQDTATLDDLIAQYDAFSESSDPTPKGEAAREWGDVSPAYYADRANQARQMLTALNAMPNQGAQNSGPESAILRHLLQNEIDAYVHDTARLPFVGDWGFFSMPTYTAARTRLRTEADAKAWIAQLNDTPRFFGAHTANMRRGIQTGWTANKDPLATVMDQINEQIFSDPTKSSLYGPLSDLSNTDLDPATVAALQADGKAAVANAIRAYSDLLRFMQVEYAPNVRAGAGIAKLDGGPEAYAAAIANHTAGSGLSAEDIHLIGQSEVARIRAEMEAIVVETGVATDFADFTNFLRTDPQFYARSPEDLLEKASEMSKRLDALLPQYFGKLPRLPYGVAAVPAAIAPGYTTGRYSSGDQEKGIAGTYLVNTYALDQRPLYELPALSAHEAVPGHHLQIALAQELTDVPDFRKSYYATAFGEGWGLYAEKLAGEAGFYRTPYERFGQLSYEMWRACRLVSDTGLHYYGWTREQAAACFIDNTALAPLNIETEVTRYIGWPGQALAYKIGEMKILELRQYAKDELGEAFDIRAFHDHLLGAGAMPLDAMDARMRAWVEGQK
jgi:uncharacterized protein (DUF885 family)